MGENKNKAYKENILILDNERKQIRLIAHSVGILLLIVFLFFIPGYYSKKINYKFYKRFELIDAGRVKSELLLLKKNNIENYSVYSVMQILCNGESQIITTGKTTDKNENKVITLFKEDGEKKARLIFENGKLIDRYVWEN